MQSYFHKNSIDFLVAPHSACAQVGRSHLCFSKSIFLTLAQLANIEGTDWCDAVAGSSEILMFDVEKVITKLDFERQEFSWVTRRTCIEALGVGSTSMFVDACLLSGSCFLPTLPQLDADLLQPAKPAKIRAAADLMKRLGVNGHGLCLHYQDEPAMQALDYLDRYRKSFLAVKHHIVLSSDGRLEPLNKNDAPGDMHAFMGQRLPDELYFYLSRGVVSPRVLYWRMSGEIMESPPLDGGSSPAYHELVRDKLAPHRSSALSLLSYSLHRFYQHRDVVLKCWFDLEEGKTLAIGGVADTSSAIAGWNVHLATIEQKAADLKVLLKSCVIFINFADAVCQRNISSLAFAVDSLRDSDFAKKTIKPKTSDHKPLRTKDEVCSNALWRFLQLRGYVSGDHTLSALGQSLHTGYSKAKGPEQEESVLLALELLRLNVLNSDNMFPTTQYGGAPFRGSETDKRNTLLVSRVACLGRMRHKSIGFTGPLSRHLLAYHSIISAVRGSLRDLVEMSLCTMLLNGNVSRDTTERELTEMGFR